MIMVDKRQAGLDVAAEMLSPEIAKALEGAATSPEFGALLGELAVRNVFGELWARPGLDRRSRSLVTLGILIALRATDELQCHVVAAIRNGLTAEEVAEVIYHSSAYAGFPAANTARAAAVQVLQPRRSGD